MTLSKYVKKGFKIVCWIIGSIIGLFLLLVLLIQIPTVQDVIKNKAVAYLEGKIHTPVSIGSIEIGLPKKIILEDIYLQSQIGDTLLAGKKITIDISLFKLLDDEVEINAVSLDGIIANVKRDKDSVFNFDYIIDAFASKTPKKDSKPTIFSVHKISLKDIRLHFDDAVTKNNLNASLISFDTNMKTFDLEKMDFDVPKINLHGLTVKLKQGELVREIATKTIVTTDSLIKKRPDLKIKLGKIDFTKINIGYDNAGTRLNSGLILNKLFIDFEETNLQKQKIAIDRFELTGLKGGLTLGRNDRRLNINTLQAQETPNWQLSLNTVSLQQIDFRFDDENTLRVKRGIDYRHLNVEQLQLEAKGLKYANEVVSGNIKSFTAKEQSGVNIQALRTDFTYSPRGVNLKNLYLKTPQTLLRNQVGVNYPSVKALQANPGILGINASLQNSHVSVKDILLFAPEVSEVALFKNNPNAIAKINGQVKGQLQDLIFPKMQISGIGTVNMIASGRIIGLPDGLKAWYNLDIKYLQLQADDVRRVIGDEYIPGNIQLPARMNVKGRFRGKLDNFNTDIVLNSSFGGAKIKTHFDYRVKNKERYNGVAELNNFDMGQLIKDHSIGKVTAKAKIKGTGLNPKTATATVDGFMRKGDFNGYTYQNLALKGGIVNGDYQATANSTDPNLEFDLVSKGSFKNKYPEVQLQLNLALADLEKLHFHTGPLKVRGQLEANLPTADPDFLNGKIAVHHLLFSNGKEQFQLDSINITAIATAEKNTLQIKSQLLKARMEGKYQLSQIATALSNSIANYYDVKPSVKKKLTPSQRFDFDINVSNDPVITQLFPEITQLQPISIKGRYNSVNDTIVLRATVPKLVYGTNTITNAVVNINTKDDALVYNVFIDEIQNAQLRLPGTSIEGVIKENTLGFSLRLLDDKSKDQYLVAGNLKAINGHTEFHLSPEDLLLNYEKWTVSENNLIRFGNDGIYANDFTLRNEGSLVRLQSQSNMPNAPLLINFTDFNIATLSRMVQKEALAFGGIIDGEVRLENLNTQFIFVSDLTIENFSFKKETIGNISLKVDNRVANTYAVQATLSEKGNQVALNGVYRYGDQSFDLNLDMQQLNLLSIQPFTYDQLTKSSGYVSGKFHIKGTFDQPKIIGELQFHNGAFTVTKLNSAFELLNDSMSFTEAGMVFKKFTLSDSKKNTLELRGKVDTPNYRDFAFDLRINADNFRVTNSTAKDNDLYYGKLFVDTRLRVKGDLNKPVVEGNIKVNKSTELTIVLPQSDPAIADREGIVEFIDQDAPLVDERFAVTLDSLNKSKFKGMDVSVNIEVNKEAELTLIIDKGNGDYLKLKGEAQLTGGIDESGKTTLTGRYELKEGSYEMTFNFLKRKFEIREGSYILWTGEPTSADINIKAVYKTKTAPIDLLDDQLGDVSPTVRNTYKQRIPFETVLKMNGELLKPVITFDIILPEGNYNVSSEIVSTTRTKLAQLRQQPDELNKQVFALLLLNRFIGENPFASEAGSGTETFARQSVSKILSQQLNNLAGDLIKGVEVDLDLETSNDYTTGEKANRTDLNVGVSKQLLNDRLKVTVGSSFGIEGPEQANRDLTNIAGDVSVSYQLSKDGRYMLRAYRKNEYQIALQGQIIETGVAFIITMDYNKFTELFHRSEEEKRIKEALKRKMKRDKALEDEQKEQPPTEETEKL
ncbi:translocation/assembly module TamB domain-containing protein [Flavobacterium terrisoli]|uniref:translocation/assembly module TamB domain-containing protein n=1 Tax=Flavobacterium terrisoli TaxID=3242195 RepID=UPI002542C8AA|nr:translocation/assembly module TamB [Flavobacterium buctense]